MPRLFTLYICTCIRSELDLTVFNEILVNVDDQCVMLVVIFVDSISVTSTGSLSLV